MRPPSGSVSPGVALHSRPEQAADMQARNAFRERSSVEDSAPGEATGAFGGVEP